MSNRPEDRMSSGAPAPHDAPASDDAPAPDDTPARGESPAPGDGSGDDTIPATGEGPEGKESPDERAAVDEARTLTRTRARDLRFLLARYISRHLPELPESPEKVPEPPKAAGAYARLLPYLQLIPWILAALFAFSFMWDFPDVEVQAFGFVLQIEGLLRILSVSGLIGFLTNWLAITMLFNPRERRPIFGQGLIPAQRERVIYRLAKAVSEELINETIIKEKIESSRIIPKYRDVTLAVTRGVVEDPEFRRELKGLTADYLETVLSSEAVRRRITQFLGEKLERFAGKGVGGFALRAYRFLNEEDFQRRVAAAVQELPSNLDTALDDLDRLLDRIPEKIEARSDEIEQWVTRVVLGFVENLDVYDIIITNIEQYDERKLEALIKNTSNEQLNYIKYLGGVLGCIGGFVIWRPFISIVVLALIGGVLYLIDETLYRRAKG